VVLVITDVLEENIASIKSYMFSLDECHLLGCDAVWFLYELRFRKNASPPSSGWRESVS
jgi:hypothetical protein